MSHPPLLTRNMGGENRVSWNPFLSPARFSPDGLRRNWFYSSRKGRRRKKKGFQSGKLRVGRGRALCPLGPTKEDTTVRHPQRQSAWAKYEFVSRLNQTFFVPSWRQYTVCGTPLQYLKVTQQVLFFFLSYKRKYNLVSLCVGSPRKWLGESVGGRGLERAEKRRGTIWSWSLVRTEEEKRGRRGWELGVNKIPIRGGCVGVEKLKSERGEQGFAIFAQI